MDQYGTHLGPRVDLFEGKERLVSFQLSINKFIGETFMKLLTNYMHKIELYPT